MRTRIFTRCILFVLLLILVACREPATPQKPTVTILPPKVETPTIVVRPTSTTIPTVTPEPEKPVGQIAYAHMEAISEGIGARPAGTAREAQTAQYIIMEFERLGYVSELRPFRVTVKGKIIDSANVIAVKPGASTQEIIVGAHYDSVKVSSGADDNASGVAVILEVAARLRDRQTPYTIRFILFGAEEAELQGSRYYAGQMLDDQIKNTIAMINLDSLTTGDMAYIYGDQGEKGAIRDWALEFAADHNLVLQTQPGDNPKYPAGTTGDWSDHAPFKEAGIPYTYLEATNWTLGNKDGYTQVSTKYGEGGEIWHTEYDTLEYINTTFPGRVQDRLHLFVTVLQAILTEYEVAR